MNTVLLLIRGLLIVLACLGVLGGLLELVQSLLFIVGIGAAPHDLNKPFDGAELIGYMFGAAALSAVSGWGIVRLRAWSIGARCAAGAGRGGDGRAQ